MPEDPAPSRPRFRLSIPQTPENSYNLPPLPPPTTTTTTTPAISYYDLHKIQVLERRNGATIHKVQQISTSQLYALKTFHAANNPAVRQQLLREIEILQLINSPHVIRCYVIFEMPSGDDELLYEYMDAGSLETLLRRNGSFSENLLVHIARQVLEGLNYLHGVKIVHRDIKAANLLVNSNMEIKISDFGLGKIIRPTVYSFNSSDGTVYMSPQPQTYAQDDNLYAEDIWSLGVTLLELYGGGFLFLEPGEKPDWAVLTYAICFGEPSLYDCSGLFRSFIECCLHKDLGLRWTASQLLAHPFLAL